MPISASAKKSLRVAERRAVENKAMKARLKNQLKKTSAETLGEMFSLLDKATKNHLMHKNKAARLKSRLAKRLATTEAAPAKPKISRARKPKATA